MSNVLAIQMRPKSLDDLIGADKLVSRLRRRFESNRIPKAMLFCGQTGGGKTTLAKIVARSLQCTHHKKFGEFCSRCWKDRKLFDIDETNAAKVRGVDEIEKKIASSDLFPMPGSKYRVYILDEAQQLSDHAQNLLLKYGEECPSTTMFIFTTTREDKIIRTLRRRCRIYVMPALDMKGVRKLVKKALRKSHSDLDSTELVEQLWSKDVTSPGLILNAVESYLEGATPEEASEVESQSEVTTKSLCRQIIKGDWEEVSGQLRKMNPEDAPAIKGAVCGYLRGMLVGGSEISSRSNEVSKSILKLASLNGGSDTVEMAALTAVLYGITKYFRRG